MRPDKNRQRDRPINQRRKGVAKHDITQRRAQLTRKAEQQGIAERHQQQDER